MYVCICSTDESFIDLHFSVFVVEFEKTEKKKQKIRGKNHIKRSMHYMNLNSGKSLLISIIVMQRSLFDSRAL